MNAPRRITLLLLGLTACVLNWNEVAHAQVEPATPSLNGPTNAPPLITITLQDALQRAQKNNPDFRAALTELGIAREDKVQGRAALLPNVNFNGSAIYTQGDGTRSNTPAFIANNGVHEYISQGNVHQNV